MERLRKNVKPLTCKNDILELAKSHPVTVDKLNRIVSSFVKQLKQGVEKDQQDVPPPPPLRREHSLVKPDSTYAIIESKVCPMIVPRAKVDIFFGKDRIGLAPASGDQVVLVDENIETVVILQAGLSSCDDLSMGTFQILIVLKEAVPFRTGKAANFLFSPDSKYTHEIPLRYEYGPLNAKSLGADTEDGPVLQGAMSRILRDLVALVLKSSIVIASPEVFRNSIGGFSLKCYHGVNDGVLYILQSCIVFVKKPLLYIPFKSIKSINIMPNNTRFLSLVVDVAQDDGEKQQTFHTISIEENPNLQSFVACIERLRGAAASSANQESNEGSEITAEGGSDSDDSDDSDFDGGNNSDSDANSFDSSAEEASDNPNEEDDGSDSESDEGSTTEDEVRPAKRSRVGKVKVER